LKFSQTTIDLFKRYFEKAEGKELTNEEVLLRMNSDPNPEFYDRKMLLKQFQEEEYVHSDLVKEVAKEQGIEL